MKRNQLDKKMLSDDYYVHVDHQYTIFNQFIAAD